MKVRDLVTEEEKEILYNTYYHVTPAVNLSKIRKEGLKVYRGERTKKMSDESALYAFNDLVSLEDALVNWLGDEFNEEQTLAILRIDLPEGEFDVSQTEHAGFEFKIKEDIPPKYIRFVRYE